MRLGELDRSCAIGNRILGRLERANELSCDSGESSLAPSYAVRDRLGATTHAGLGGPGDTAVLTSPATSRPAAPRPTPPSSREPDMPRHLEPGQIPMIRKCSDKVTGVASRNYQGGSSGLPTFCPLAGGGGRLPVPSALRAGRRGDHIVASTRLRSATATASPTVGR